MAANGNFSQQDQYKGAVEQYPATAGQTTEPAAANGSSNGDLSKDEVGWYFVEQYYTTLSKSPEKLHLFYGKRSQFVSGIEAEVCTVAVGRSAIQERIANLGFQDCKVRVLNVDSQASFDNIVIQVIGETSNKPAEIKKFVQTFVLAQQPTGYFVLNDIFRYILEDRLEEGEPEEPVAEQEPVAEEIEAPKSAPVEEHKTELEAVDKKLEETLEAEPAAAAAPETNGDEVKKTEVDQAEEAPAAATKPVEEIPTPEVAEKEVEEEVIKEAEKPKDPEPTPAVTRAPSSTTTATKPAPAQPAAPAKPLSWASRAAAAAAVGTAARPPVAMPKQVPAPAQPRAAPVAQKETPPAAAAATQPAKETSPAQASEWQSVGGDSKRQTRPQSVSIPAEKEGALGYVKNVTEKVNADDLKAALQSFGELVYFDVNRAKNCAFVEYSTPAGYQAAAAANPHSIGGEQIYVEPRRPKAAYSAGFNGNRGGMNNRGRGGFERQSSQGGRGNFANRGRGGAARGGRGGAQAATS